MIYNENCLEGMKSLSDNSIDLICTDPPYCVGMTMNGIKGGFSDFVMLKPFLENLFSE